MAEVFYTVSSDLHRVARLEKGKVVELDFEISGKPVSLLGGIFLGRVIEIQKPLHAAFVDIGMTKPGMLPLREHKLSPVKQGDMVMVQVNRTENPLEDKGVRLTRMITLSLGPLLYTPLKGGLSFSKKLNDRESFKDLLSLQAEEGLIVRSWALPDKCLANMLSQLRSEWEAIQKQLPEEAPVCLSSPLPLLTRIVRSLDPSDTFITDDRQVATQANKVASFSLQTAFDERCEEAWESLFSAELPLSQGGNLYIEETRGLVVIDVNSQGALRSAISFNREAIKEALRQIRLRDLGGKIVIDLVDRPKTLNPLMQGIAISSEVEIWGLSAMGLLEMIRRRKRLSLPHRLKHQLN